MVIERQWGFEHDDEEAPQPPPPDPAPGATGRDATGSVSVGVAPDGAVTSVRLGPAWRDSVGPRNLGAAVVDAATAAAVVAMAHMARPAPAPPVAARAGRPLTTADATRLLRAAVAELDTYASTSRAAGSRVEAVESGGGHVTATARAGQLAGVVVDTGWATRSPDREIEAELADAVRAAHERTADAAVTPHPGPALIELRAIAVDPRAASSTIGRGR